MALPERKIALHLMVEHDLLEVVQIEEQSGLSRWGWDAYFQELNQPTRAIMFVTRTNPGGSDATRISGFVAARVESGDLHINNIAVRKEFRSEGIGGFLLDGAIEEGIRRGAVASRLEVRASNLPAIALYSSRGFREVGRRRNYYASPTEDAIVMKRSLWTRT